MKKILLGTICLFLLLNVTKAQIIDTTMVKPKHEFGLHLGATTGMGLSYRYWPEKFGVQFTLLPLKTDNEVVIDFAVTALYSFYNSKWVHFFGYFGNNIVYEKDRDIFYNWERRSRTDVRYNFGMGPGFGFGTKVRFNVMAGYGFYDFFDDFTILPTGEIGLYFRL